MSLTRSIGGQKAPLLWAFLLPFSIGICFYSVGPVLFYNAPYSLAIMGFVTIIAFLCGALFFQATMGTMTVAAGASVAASLNDIPLRVWIVILFGYFLLLLLPLAVPTWRIGLLFMPPRPDIGGELFSRLDGAVPPVVAAADALRVLLQPLVFIALYRFRKSVAATLIVVLLIVYITYVRKEYISRGEVASWLIIFGAGLWVVRPSLRPAILIAAGATAIIAIFLAHWYAAFRIGGATREVDLLGALEVLAEGELRGISENSVRVIDAGQQANLGGYAVWVTTLPIPKFLTGPIEGIRLNYDIASFLLREKIGEAGWYVVLSGFVAESVYLFGRNLFWLHGFMFGAIASGLSCIVRGRHLFAFLSAWLLVIFAYVLPRGGVGAALPQLVNGLLLLYILMLFTLLRANVRSRRASRSTHTNR